MVRGTGTVGRGQGWYQGRELGMLQGVLGWGFEGRKSDCCWRRHRETETADGGRERWSGRDGAGGKDGGRDEEEEAEEEGCSGGRSRPVPQSRLPGARWGGPALPAEPPGAPSAAGPGAVQPGGGREDASPAAEVSGGEGGTRGMRGR